MSMVSPKPSFLSIFLLFLTSLISKPTSLLATQPHEINFKSLNLYPEGLAWDPSDQHFLIGSLNQRTISSISDAGVIETFISDLTLPENVTFSSLAIDSLKKRLLVTVHSQKPLPPFNALAAYDLRSRQRLFLSPLNDDENDGSYRPIANDVAVDFKGNAFVTNSAGNFIWKVDENGEASIFSRSPQFTAYPVDRGTPYGAIGLNGIAYVSKGYLLVVQSNTGKVFKVSEDDGRAKVVLLNEDLIGGDDIAIRRDGVVFVVSPVNNKMWLLKSQDSWAEGVVYDKVDVDLESFSIQEVRSKKDDEDDNVWVFILIGLGLAYFMFWRFQMRQLVTKMDKKIN